MTDKILLTDYAWPDLQIERSIIEAAGYSLVAGPPKAGTPDEITALIREHNPVAIMTNWAEVTADGIGLPTRLAIVARLGVGLDNIAVTAATARGAYVTNVPDYCVEEVSDHVVGLLLAWTRGIVFFDRSVKAGAWAPASARLLRTSTLSVGILGYGRIGRRSAEKLKPFNVTLRAWSRKPAASDGIVEFGPLEEVLAASDVVILHLPLVPETHHLMNEARLRLIRPGGFLINVARGPVVDSAALERVLDDGALSGAGLDVVEGEPDPPRGLVDRPNVIVTPHAAFSSVSSIAELRTRVARQVVIALDGGRPPNVCHEPATGGR